MAELKADGRVRIESVRLHRQTRGVVPAGPFVSPLDSTTAPTASLLGFPPAVTDVPLTRATGAVVPAGTTAALVVGLRAT